MTKEERKKSVCNAVHISEEEFAKSLYLSKFLFRDTDRNVASESLLDQFTAGFDAVLAGAYLSMSPTSKAMFLMGAVVQDAVDRVRTKFGADYIKRGATPHDMGTDSRRIETAPAIGVLAMGGQKENASQPTNGRKRTI